MVTAIEEKMREELEPYSDTDFISPPTKEEEIFLKTLSKIDLTEAERNELLSTIKEEEISYILTHEVEKDSSPGEDGITYRFMSIFWKWPEFKFLYLKYLNFTREDGSMGLLENSGIMTIKNKKMQSNLYEKKRKLTKVNKESNLGNGKVWTNRFKNLIIPKILPKTQFNCQPDVNIIDELREIRDVNRYLLGEGKHNQVDGTILSIDFKDAFRSVSHRWLNLVLVNLGIPQSFIDWFWMMYKDLYVIIVLNRYKSNKIYVKRGLMEGHPPSMAAFVVSMIPLMHIFEEQMAGIRTPNGKTHRIKSFADDLKLFIKDPIEITKIYDVISKFENISGLEMHRDPSRNKCQALPFGRHRDHQGWPAWITVQSTMKVVGGMFSNCETLEKINSDLVQKCFFDALNKAYGIRGTVFQKAYFVNTYLFSKIWFTSQFISLDEQILNKILSKAIEFIYAGENEKTIRPLNFRSKSKGGLGLIHPVIKAKAFLVKHMNKEFVDINSDAQCIDINYYNRVNMIYGCKEVFDKVSEKGLGNESVKDIYEFLIQDITHRNQSLIPSRNERRSLNVKWGLVFQTCKWPYS